MGDNMAGMKINPRQMKQAMRQMGITNEEIPNVTEVIIRTADKEIVISPAAVNVMTMKGQKSFQVDGESFERPLGSSGEAPAPLKFNSEDIELVMAQTGCDKEKAVAALEACDGELAEAILKVMGE